QRARAAAGEGQGGRRGRRHLHQADGRRGRTAPRIHPGQFAQRQCGCVSGGVPPIQYIVEGGHRLTGTIEPSGNKNAALPIIAAALLTEHPVTLENVPRIRDTETLVELVRSVGASGELRQRNTLATPKTFAPTISIRCCARGFAPRSFW